MFTEKDIIKFKELLSQWETQESAKQKMLAEQNFWPQLQQNFVQPNFLSSLQIQPKDTTPTQNLKYEKRYFADEKKIVEEMKQAWYDENIARQTIENRRKDILPVWTKLNPDEAVLLIKMADAWITTDQAVKGLKEFRSAEKKKQWEKMNPVQKVWKTYLDFVVWTLWGWVWEVWWFVDFATQWKTDLWKMWMEWRETARQVASWKAWKAWEIFWAWIMDYAAFKWAWKIWWAWAKFSKLSPAKQIITAWAGFWWITPIWEKWAEATKWDIAKSAVIWWAVWFGLSWLPWRALKWAWSKLYKTAVKPNAKEAWLLLKAEAKWTTAPITRADTALKYWLTWTEESLWVKSLRQADKIFSKQIEPALKKSKITHNIDDLFNNVEQTIKKSSWWELRKKELMDWLAALKDDYAKIWKKSFDSMWLQLEKSSLDSFTAQKIFKWQEVASWYNQVKNYLANEMRQTVRDDLAKLWVKNAKTLYRDYANLVELSKIWVKWITEWWLKWWFGTFWSTLYDVAATPIKTIGWNMLYKTWSWLEFIWPKWLKTFWNYLATKNMTVKNWNIVPSTMKTKLWDLTEKIAEKTWAKLNFMDTSWIWSKLNLSWAWKPVNSMNLLKKSIEAWNQQWLIDKIQKIWNTAERNKLLKLLKKQ